jgi:hypothetical protein
MKEDLKLYVKPESVKPDAGTNHLKPFGSDVKGSITMGNKYVTKYKANPEPANIDYDKIMKFTMPRAPAAGFGGK